MGDEKTVIWETTNFEGWALRVYRLAGALFCVTGTAWGRDFSWTMNSGDAHSLAAALLTWALSVAPKPVDAATEERWGRELAEADGDLWSLVPAAGRPAFIGYAKRLRAVWGIDLMEDALARERNQRERAEEDMRAARNKMDSTVDELAGCRVLLREQTEAASMARSQRDRAAKDLCAQTALTQQERARAVKTEGELAALQGVLSGVRVRETNALAETEYERKNFKEACRLLDDLTEERRRERSRAVEAEGKVRQAHEAAQQDAKDRAALCDEVKSLRLELEESSRKLADEEGRRRRDSIVATAFINSLKEQLEEALGKTRRAEGQATTLAAELTTQRELAADRLHVAQSWNRKHLQDKCAAEARVVKLQEALTHAQAVSATGVTVIDLAQPKLDVALKELEQVNAELVAVRKKLDYRDQQIVAVCEALGVAAVEFPDLAMGPAKASSGPRQTDRFASKGTMGVFVYLCANCGKHTREHDPSGRCPGNGERS